MLYVVLATAAFVLLYFLLKMENFFFLIHSTKELSNFQE